MKREHFVKVVEEALDSLPQEFRSRAVIERFREKYGAKDVKKYYSKFDVAVVVQLT